MRQLLINFVVWCKYTYNKSDLCRWKEKFDTDVYMELLKKTSYDFYASKRAKGSFKDVLREGDGLDVEPALIEEIDSQSSNFDGPTTFTAPGSTETGTVSTSTNPHIVITKVT